MRISSAILIVVAALLTGCAVDPAPRPAPAPAPTPPPPAVAAPARSSNYDLRFKAACEMKSVSDRDQALAELADEAAAACHFETALDAINKMEKGAYRDQAAAAAALRAASQMQRCTPPPNDVVMKIALAIDDPALRDKTFAKLAKGEY